MTHSKQKHSFLYRNGLGITMLIFVAVFITAQLFTGWHENNSERAENGWHALSLSEYAVSGHFVQATFENWESEFLQMGLYVVFTIWLRQKGSAESKHLDKKEEVDRQPRPHINSPWAVKKGGWWLKVYSNSLSIAFAILFFVSFVLHFYGSLTDHNEDNLMKGMAPDTWAEYARQSRFWFESFQNWQSEFLAVASIVILSIWLRQKGSPESKPVDAPHDQTGT